MVDFDVFRDELEVFSNDFNVRIVVKNQKEIPLKNESPTSPNFGRRVFLPRRPTVRSQGKRIRSGHQVKILSKNIQLAEIDSTAIKEIFDKKKYYSSKILTPRRPNFKIDLRQKTKTGQSSQIAQNTLPKLQKPILFPINKLKLNISLGQ